MKKDDLNFRNEAMFMLKVVFLSFLIFSIPAQSMQVGKELTERISKFNLSLMKNFSSHQKTRDDMLIKSTSIFNGSQPKKQFSAKDMIKDDTISRLTTYAKPINYEGTLLKVKKQESHKESENIKQFSILRAPTILDNKFLDGLFALYDRRNIIQKPYVYPHYLNGFLLAEFSSGTYQRGSGLLIGNKYGLTAKHCLFDANEKEAKSGDFLLGATNNFTLKKTSIKKWKAHDSLDVAVFELDRPVGDDIGWASLRELTTTEVMDSPFEVSVTGYPAYKRFLSYYRKQENDMFTMYGPVLKIIGSSIYYDVDTSGGQSGSGITKFENNILESYGVHTNGTKNPVDGNEGVRIDSDLLSFIEKFIKDNK